MTPTATLSSGSRLASAKDAEADTYAEMLAFGNAINARLEGEGAEYRVGRLEWLGHDTEGRDIIFEDRGNKHLVVTLQGHTSDYVPGDPRFPRLGRTNVTYVVVQSRGDVGALTAAQTTAAIDRAMATWQDVDCSTIPITRLPNIAGNGVGVAVGLAFSGADVTHAGWINLPVGILGVTATFFRATDINNDGRFDTAFSEIYYNRLLPGAFQWSIDGNIDVESVALHEAGHGLSQAHFGALFVTPSNGMVHFSPRAVMNAGYTGVQQVLTGTDNGGHCTSWGSWPAQ